MLDELEQRLDGATSRALADAVVAAMADGVLVSGDPVAADPHGRPRTRPVPDDRERRLGDCSRRSATIRTDGRRGTVVVGRRGDGALALPPRGGPPPHGVRPRPVDRGARPGVAARPAAGAALAVARGPPGRATSTTRCCPDWSTLLRADWPYEADEISVHDGAMDALELVARTVLGFGDRVVVENPASRRWSTCSSRWAATSSRSRSTRPGCGRTRSRPPCVRRSPRCSCSRGRTTRPGCR